MTNHVDRQQYEIFLPDDFCNLLSVRYFLKLSVGFSKFLCIIHDSYYLGFFVRGFSINKPESIN